MVEQLVSAIRRTVRNPISRLRRWFHRIKPMANRGDITSGNDGLTCLPGYDLVTGRGSWIPSSTQSRQDRYGPDEVVTDVAKAAEPRPPT
jgi:hypothetical protein